VAKGIRKTKSKIGARLEPMSHVDIQLYKGRELDTVSQVELIDSSARLHNNLDKLTQGMSMLEAVDQIAEDREPSPHLYRMLQGALNATGFTFNVGTLIQGAGGISPRHRPSQPTSMGGPQNRRRLHPPWQSRVHRHSQRIHRLRSHGALPWQHFPHSDDPARRRLERPGRL
jgi:hypothetical protein